MAPSPAAGGGSKASLAEEALLGGAGCGNAGQAPSLGDVNSLFPLGTLLLPMLCPSWEWPQVLSPGEGRGGAEWEPSEKHFQPLWLVGVRRSGRGEPALHGRSGSARRDRAHGRDGQHTLAAAGGAQAARQYRVLLQLAAVKERRGEHHRYPRVRVTSWSVGSDPGSMKPDGAKWEEPQAWPGGRLAVYRVNRLRAALMDGRCTHSASPAPEPALWESQCRGREADLPELSWPGSSSPSPAAALRPGLDRVRVEAPEE